MNRELLLDSYWTFLTPLVCLFSLCTNMINIIVFRSIKSRNIIYKYMLVNSIADQVYLMCVMFIFIARCGQFCDIKDTYLTRFYFKYIYMYGANTAGFFSMLIEIGIMLQRFATLRNKTFLKNTNKKLALACLLTFCVLFHVPQLSTFEIRHSNRTMNSWFGQKAYSMEYVYDKNFLIRNWMLIQTILRLILIATIVVLLNCLFCFVIKKYESIRSNRNERADIATTSLINQIQSPMLSNFKFIFLLLAPLLPK